MSGAIDMPKNPSDPNPQQRLLTNSDIPHRLHRHATIKMTQTGDHKLFIRLATMAAIGVGIATAEMTWHWNSTPGERAIRGKIEDSMNRCVATWNEWSDYDFAIGVVFGAGTPTADASYRGQIRFGGMRNYRVAMHESSHWMGTGTVPQWRDFIRDGRWTGTYAANLLKAFDGPGERMNGDAIHYWPYGANFDSEGVNAPRMIGLIGAFRRDMDLPQGDRTIGIAPGTYRLRNRQSVMMLGAGEAGPAGVPVFPGEITDDSVQTWQVLRIPNTRYFKLRNVARNLYLDASEGRPVRLTRIGRGGPTASQRWEIKATDSFFFHFVNQATRRPLGMSSVSAGPPARSAEWTFLHPMAQIAPQPGVISQGRPATASSRERGNHEEKANNGVPGDRWTAASNDYPQWWRVDLGEVMPLARVETDWFDDGGRSYQYLIEVSDNDIDYTVAADRTDNTTGGTTVDPLDLSARYLRVTVVGASHGWAAIQECRVYHAGEPLQLLSLHRPTTASSEQHGNLAVNGNDGESQLTRWAADNPGFPAWWQVDLGGPRQVNMAVIEWFGDGGRSYQYRIDGSLDGVHFTPLADLTENTTPARTTVDRFSGMARHLRVTIVGASQGWAGFHQVQIYGTGESPP